MPAILAPTSPISYAAAGHNDPHLTWVMAVLHGVLALNFAALGCALLLLVRRTRTAAARDWSRLGAGFAFVFALCAAAYLMEGVSSWNSSPWLALWVDAVSVAASGYIAVKLLRRGRSMAVGANDYAARVSRMEAAMAEMEASLVAAQRLEDWNRMSAVVTHEISNPLESIQNILYLIRQSDAATPELVRLTRMASDEADRILTISRSTLAFFRQSSTPERVDLRAVADSVRFLLEPVLRRRELVLDVRGSGDLAVQALSCELRQALLNLVRNACEATPRGGPHITLKLTGRMDDVEIILEDHGAGVDRDHLPSLFHFGRTTKGSEGNGVGLWTVKHIIDRHGGQIRVDSHPGIGTTFTILWPRHFSLSSGADRQRSPQYTVSESSARMPAQVS